jgi:predicted XRE-type DNA-binding protein
VDGVMKIKKSSENVFEDIGFSTDEAAMLKLKSSLMIAVEEHIQANRFTPSAAAKAFGVQKSKIQKLLAGRFNEFNIKMLLTMLVHAGMGVELVCTSGGRKPRKAA